MDPAPKTGLLTGDQLQPIPLTSWLLRVKTIAANPMPIGCKPRIINRLAINQRIDFNAWINLIGKQNLAC